MPIGKNSLKRVTNNGYSAVKTEAPDMENSVTLIPEEKPAPAPEKSLKDGLKKGDDILAFMGQYDDDFVFLKKNKR